VSGPQAGDAPSWRLRAVSAGYQLGWQAVRLVPERLARWVFARLADISWRRRGAGVRQLEANLRRIMPDATEDQLRQVSRASMRSYLRYWVEAFRLPVTPRERIVSGMRVTGEEQTVLDCLRGGRGVIFALPHMGNVDLAAAWMMTRDAGQICVVAERLRPESLFRQFVAYRESLGMEVLPHTGGPRVFGVLAQRLRAGRLVCLVADRDLDSGGADVVLCGEKARISAGPATLALHTGAALMPVTLWFDGSGWGAHIYPPIAVPVPENASRRERIAAMTQQVATAWETDIVRHPQDWHMLQQIFAADLGDLALEADRGGDHRREGAPPAVGVGRAAAGRAALLVPASVTDQNATACRGAEILEPRAAAGTVGESWRGGLAVRLARLGDSADAGDGRQRVRAAAGDTGDGDARDGAGRVDAPAVGAGELADTLTMLRAQDHDRVIVHRIRAAVDGRHGAVHPAVVKERLLDRPDPVRVLVVVPHRRELQVGAGVREAVVDTLDAMGRGEGQLLVVGFRGSLDHRRGAVQAHDAIHLEGELPGRRVSVRRRGRRCGWRCGWPGGWPSGWH
jgi:phosphatidylinositol dimannoside acyltransferase